MTIMAVAGYFIFIPLFKILSIFLNRYLENIKPKDPVAEAQKRLRIAESELEAAILNKKTEKIIDELYHETLEDDTHPPSESHLKR